MKPLRLHELSPRLQEAALATTLAETISVVADGNTLHEVTQAGAAADRLELTTLLEFAQRHCPRLYEVARVAAEQRHYLNAEAFPGDSDGSVHTFPIGAATDDDEAEDGAGRTH